MNLNLPGYWFSQEFMQCHLLLEEERIIEKQEWSHANETRKGTFLISIICDGF